MEEIRLMVASDAKTQRFRMNFLSGPWRMHFRYETPDENLKNYTLENSALAQEMFIADSLKLDEMRMGQSFRNF